MPRGFGLLLAMAMALGIYLMVVLVPSDGAGSASAIGAPPVAYGGWVAGLLMGLVLAWFAGLDWRTLPERLCAWLRLQRRRFGWMLIGGLCAGILLLL